MYKVEYWANSSQEWQEYIAPAWGAKRIRHRYKAEAEDRAARLQGQHPNDRFRVRKAY